MPSVPGAGDGGAVDVDGDTPALGKTKSAIPVERERTSPARRAAA